jgi:hypothetical protein
LGYRNFNFRRDSTVYFVPSCASIAVVFIRLRRDKAWADANRAFNGAMPCVGFNGLPGDTIHQISSRLRASSANRLIDLCPPCAGLNDPPSSPTVFPLALPIAFKAALAHCRGPAIYKWSALPARPDRAHVAAQLRCQFLRLDQIPRHRQIAMMRCA